MDKQWNIDIRDKLKVQNIVEEIQNYQTNWLQRVRRMDSSRIPKLALQYRPIGILELGP